MFFLDHNIYSPEHLIVHAFTKTGNRRFPLHIHRPYECFAVKTGKATVTINDVDYKLLPGEAVLVFPYQKHCDITELGSEVWTCTFSPDLVKSFSNAKTGIPLSNKFNFTAPEQNEFESLLMKKSLAYHICGIFDKNASYTEDVAETNDLLMKIFNYMMANYLGECKLEDVCRYVGYDYGYISKFFKKMVGQNFKSYVTNLRISEACRMLRETDMNIETISEKCGFGTVRNFNIAFLALTEKTPREYRMGATKKL